MEIVLATNGLIGIGGGETYLLTVAEHLQRLGHEVTVHAAEGGAMSALMESRSVRVAIGERALPEACDVALVQDAGMAYALADRWPQTPQVFRAPSALYDFQSPPQLPGIVAAVVVCSDRMARHAEALAGEREIVRLRQPIDIKRMCPRGEIRSRPLRALLLGNYVSGRRRKLIEAAWGEAGFEVVTVGAHGTPAPEPAGEIAAADIVVGKARAILDAMACGRAAYVLDVAGGDGWVTGERYAAMEADNFAGHTSDWSLDQLAGDIAGYDPAMGQGNRDLVPAHHDAADHAQARVALFRRLSPRAEPATGPLREMARLVRLQWASDQDVIALRQALLEERARAVIAEEYAASLEVERQRLDAEIERLTGPRRWPGAVAGDHSLIRERVVLAAGAVVGSGSGIGPGCRIGEGSRLMPGVVHPVTMLRRGCRIAANVTLLPNVEIGEEAVVGAGSVVTRSVPPRRVVVVSPARVLLEVRDDELAG